MKINPALLNKTYLQNSNTSQVKDDLGFKDFLVKKVEEVDQAQKKAENLLNALAKGEDVDLSDLAITMSKAETELKLLLRVRNKIIEAYQEIMRMQI
jgi:flagellar hook-basal body complex protein FliE